jgi:hypothetical protein
LFTNPANKQRMGLEKSGCAGFFDAAPRRFRLCRSVWLITQL